MFVALTAFFVNSMQHWMWAVCTQHLWTLGIVSVLAGV